jgi:hypothetical protein
MTKIKKLIVYIALLNLLDGLSTSFGLYYHAIDELNPLMRYVADLNPFYICLLKAVLSGALILYSIYYPKLLETEFWLIIYKILLIIYLIILGMHILWICQIINAII